MIQINENNFDAETKEGVVLLDFYADWCQPCKMLVPALEGITGVKVCKVNIDTQSALATKFKVASIPTLVFLKDGVPMDTMVGLQSAQILQAKVDEVAAK